MTAFWLSPQQKHAWNVLQAHASASAAMVMLEGPIDPGKLRQAIHQVANRHEILRTVFRRTSGMKLPFQFVLEAGEPLWDIVPADSEISSASALRKREQETRPSLEDGPVLRALLSPISSQRALLMLALPALCCDTYSLKRLASEVGLFYAGRTDELVQEPLPYRQFAQWQNDILETVDEYAQEAQRYWQNLQTLPVAHLAPPANSGAEMGFHADCVSATVSQHIVNSVDATEDAPDVLFAAWQSVLWRVTGQTSFATSRYFDGREFEELDGALGRFGKFAPMPANFDGDLRFREVVDAVRDARKKAEQSLEHFIPREEGEPDASFSYEEYGAVEQCGGVGFRVVEAEAGGERYTLKLRCERRGGELRLAFHYDASRLSRPAVERWMEQYRTLLEAALAQPEERVSRLALVGEEEKQRLLVEWNRTAAEYPRERCFHELLEAQVELTPERAAVSCQGLTLSYRELNQRANRLAHYLRELGVGPDSRVGLCLERSVELLVGVVAILKAGGAYVALNAQHPPERLQQQLSGAAALLTEAKWRQHLPAFAGATVSVDEDGGHWSERPAVNLERVAQADNLAYVIYTSGSTGTPKGVQVRHRNLVNYAYAVMRKLEWDRAGLQFATVSTLSADLGNTCIYPALLTGGCVHVIPAEMATDSRALGRYFAEHGVDVLKIVPSHLRALLDAGGGREILPRRCLVLGGETLTVALLERIEALGGECEVVNHYGPTETTVGSLLLRIKEYEWRGGGGRSIPIGRPLANTRIYVLDGERQLVPEGVEGELYIAGAGVTAGYLEQPERTAERFVADLVEPGERMYRTGDRVRYGAGGNVEFLGRFDEQVKIRGYRVEPGELEAVLGQHPGVRQAVVTVRQQPESGEKQLLAYIVHRPESNLTVEELQRYLKARVPDYLVPSGMVVLAKLPLTANGKLDRQALPSPEEFAARTRSFEPPQTPVEQTLTAIWEQVLRRTRIGRNDNFFDIGGHSLLATQIISRVREQWRVELPVRGLFEQPTVALFSSTIEAASREEVEEHMELMPVSRESYLFNAAPSGKSGK
jgi:amino acid adenylation domain-containing protein